MGASAPPRLLLGAKVPSLATTLGAVEVPGAPSPTVPGPECILNSKVRQWYLMVTGSSPYPLGHLGETSPLRASVSPPIKWGCSWALLLVL